MGAAHDWDLEAERFDEQPDHGLQDPAVRAAWSRLLLPLMPRPVARIADLGCGTGSVTLLLAESGHVVTGVDISPAMVARARDKLDAAGVDAEVGVGDATALRLERGSFDVVMTRHVLWALDDPDDAIAHWVDLLAPGGLLLLVEGLWGTGAGMADSTVAELVLRHRLEAEVIPLHDPQLWGGPVDDERYAVLSRR
jgi:SAM-dependent methyltransferase